METVEKTRLRPIEVVEMEVIAINKLIGRRNNWLADPENRRKTTYDAVKMDTMSMIYGYKELVAELNELKSQWYGKNNERC